MNTSDIPDQITNPERLAVLWKTHTLDTPPEESFGQLTRIASRLLDAPDSYYINNWSVWLDRWILLRTFRVVLGGADAF